MTAEVPNLALSNQNIQLLRQSVRDNSSGEVDLLKQRQRAGITLVSGNGKS